MIISDFHTHSSNSGDSDEKMQVLVEEAIKNGIKHLCITEHNDFDYPDAPKGYEDEMCDFVLDVDTYYKEYNKLKEKYSSDNDFNLYFGVELGLQTHIVNENRDFIKSYPFDFVIASSHLFDKSDPYFPTFWEGKDEKELFKRYFESIYENICIFDDFDVYGHLDYILRYGKNKDRGIRFADFFDEIDAILHKLIEMGKGIEINTGGLRSGLKFPNPNPHILRRYRELNGEIITIGSDAHSGKNIADSFAVAEDILTECGFKYYTVFKDRTASFIKL